MSAVTHRQQARQRVLAVATAAVDRMIPADEAEPLRGRTFREWEDEVQEVGRELLGCLLEERAALDEAAERSKEDLGCCRYCGSDRLYLDARQVPKNRTIRSPQGAVVLSEQSVRCRQCGKSFSPSPS